jgi:hypothetical protein
VLTKSISVTHRKWEYNFVVQKWFCHNFVFTKFILSLTKWILSRKMGLYSRHPVCTHIHICFLCRKRPLTLLVPWYYFVRRGMEIWLVLPVLILCALIDKYVSTLRNYEPATQWVTLSLYTQLQQKQPSTEWCYINTNFLSVKILCKCIAAFSIILCMYICWLEL